MRPLASSLPGRREGRWHRLLRTGLAAGTLGLLGGCAALAPSPPADQSNVCEIFREQPRWYLVDVKYVRTLKQPLPLDLIRQHVLGETPAGTVKAELQKVGVTEVGFYQKRGLFEDYCKANAI